MKRRTLHGGTPPHWMAERRKSDVKTIQLRNSIGFKEVLTTKVTKEHKGKGSSEGLTLFDQINNLGRVMLQMRDAAQKDCEPVLGVFHAFACIGSVPVAFRLPRHHPL